MVSRQSRRECSAGWQSNLNVVLLQRRAVPGRHFSIERVFQAVVAALEGQIRVSSVAVPFAGVGLRTALANLRVAARVRADIVHVTGDIHYVLPAISRSSARVLTVHDLATLNRTTGLRRRVIRLLWWRWPLRCADAVTVISVETRRQLLAEFGDALAAKVVVIANPVTSPFSEVIGRPGSWRPRPLGERVVLAVGCGSNKNLPATAAAVGLLGESLRVVAKIDEAARTAIDQLGVRWSSTHSLSDTELLHEYMSADVLCFPSLNEGFGLPILEAQAAGVPVVTSDLPPMSEVAGGGAVLVDPSEPQAIADGILRLWTDVPTADRVRAAGFENLRQHLPEVIAARYAELYRALRLDSGTVRGSRKRE